jgi:serine/threonine protein phosphatase PrpC
VSRSSAQDVMDYKQAVDAVSDMTNAQVMSQKLVDLALKKGTTDNVSCMVIRWNKDE